MTDDKIIWIVRNIFPSGYPLNVHLFSMSVHVVHMYRGLVTLEWKQFYNVIESFSLFLDTISKKSKMEKIVLFPVWLDYGITELVVLFMVLRRPTSLP